jgi:hypothetical protein
MLLENFLKIKIKKNLYSLSKIIDLQKPEYFSDWDGSFKNYYYGKNRKHERPNKAKTTLNFTFKKNNPLSLNENFEGIYCIINSLMKYCYIGLTRKNIKQRLHSHIQKLTSSNINAYTTPKFWQKLSFERYKILKDKSVDISDDKILIFSTNDKELKNIALNKDLEDLEALIYCNLRKLLKNYSFLNTENSKMKTYWKLFNKK